MSSFFLKGCVPTGFQMSIVMTLMLTVLKFSVTPIMGVKLNVKFVNIRVNMIAI